MIIVSSFCFFGAGGETRDLYTHIDVPCKTVLQWNIIADTTDQLLMMKISDVF